MKNWSGRVSWQPSEILTPSTEEGIVNAVRSAYTNGKNVRMIGSGHSFMPLSATNDILISLDKYQGLISVDKELEQVTVKAGTDINVQSIAGAISTGTHGTGVEFGNMSTQVTGIRFVNGKGELHSASTNNNPELLKALQVSLGILGVITEITIQCVPSFTLALEVERLLLEDVMPRLDQLNKNNRNFEFYWFPNTPYVMTKKCNISNHPGEPTSRSEYFHEMILENYAFKLLLEVSKLLPSLTNKLSTLSAKTITGLKKIRASHQVFSTPRLVKFNEMEYNVSLEVFDDVMKDITSWVNKNNKDILFPMENRFVRGDDIYLSPAYGRKSAYMSAHVYSKKDFRPYFRGLEEIFRAYNGRPHWGKINTLTTKDFRRLYPKFEEFETIRLQHDPEEVFLSPYLKSIFSKQTIVEPTT